MLGPMVRDVMTHCDVHLLRLIHKDKHDLYFYV